MRKYRQSLAEAVSLNLQESIQQQKWKNTLPGIRILCEEMQVSRQTMMIALRHLEQDGYVKKASPGKPRDLNHRKLKPGSSAIDSSSDTKKLMVGLIAWAPHIHMGVVEEAVTDQLNKALAIQGYHHRHISFPEISSASGAKKIGPLIEQHPADIYVVMGAHQNCSRALHLMNIPVVYLGGVHVRDCVPRITFSLTDMCERAVKHLVSLGHKKITVMLPAASNRRSKDVSAAEESIQQVFLSHDLPFSTFNCPRWGKTKEEFNASLHKLFEFTPPSAIILGDAIYIPRMVSFLMKHGMKYPDDVSLIVMDESHELKEYTPPISSFKKSISSMVKLTLRKIENIRFSTGNAQEEITIAPAVLKSTDSVRSLNL